MNQIRGVPRSQVRAEWDHYVAEHPDGWWFHTNAWLDYSLAYAPRSRDHSMAIVNSNGVVAIVPSILDTETYGGQVPPNPLVTGGIAYRDENEGGATQAWRPGRGPDEHTPQGYKLVPRATNVVELSDKDEMWRRLRKSYKSLIHKAEREYEIDVYGGGEFQNAAYRIELARQVHKAAAGRVTRPQSTWIMQAEWLVKGNALLATAFRGNEPYAFAYTIRWKDWAYYASGASLEKNLSHALIWHTMLALACDGERKHFEIGHAEGESEKEQNIAFFKAGFGSSLWTVHELHRI